MNVHLSQLSANQQRIVKRLGFTPSEALKSNQTVLSGSLPDPAGPGDMRGTLVLHFREPPPWQTPAFELLKTRHFDCLRLVFPGVIRSGGGSDTSYAVERHIGRTTGTHSLDGPLGWMTHAEHMALISMFWDLRSFWADLVPLDCSTVRAVNPLASLAFFQMDVEQNPLVSVEMCQEISKQLSLLALKLGHALPGSRYSILAGAPFEAAHGGVYSSHISLDSGSGVPRIGLCSFRRVGYHYFGRDLFTAQGYRILRMSAREQSWRSWVEHLTGAGGFVDQVLSSCPYSLPSTRADVRRWLLVGLVLTLSGLVPHVLRRITVEMDPNQQHASDSYFQSVEEEVVRLEQIAYAVEHLLGSTLRGL